MASEEPKAEPMETGVVPVQQAPTPAAVALVRQQGDAGSGLLPSAMASAFQEGAAFRTQAAQVFAARWADDVHGRLQRTEEELRETRHHLGEERERAARFDERLRGISQEHGAQDRLKFLGGAVLGAGVPLVIDGKYILGVACVIVGLLLAYGIPWWRHGT
jgi:hypothetical protein